MPAGGGSRRQLSTMAPVPVALWRRGHGSNGDLTLLFLAPVFSYLPQAALGALVFVTAVGLVDIRRN